MSKYAKLEMDALNNLVIVCECGSQALCFLGDRWLCKKCFDKAIDS